MDPEFHLWVSSNLLGRAHLFLVITQVWERKLWQNALSIQPRTSSLFIAIWFCTCDWSASKVNLGVRMSLMPSFINWFILLPPFQTCMDILYCDHQSIGLIDSLVVFLPPVILTKILILGLVPQKPPPVFFSLNFKICICSAMYGIPYIFLHGHINFLYYVFFRH